MARRRRWRSCARCSGSSRQRRKSCAMNRCPRASGWSRSRHGAACGCECCGAPHRPVALRRKSLRPTTTRLNRASSARAARQAQRRRPRPRGPCRRRLRKASGRRRARRVLRAAAKFPGRPQPTPGGRRRSSRPGWRRSQAGGGHEKTPRAKVDFSWQLDYNPNSSSGGPKRRDICGFNWVSPLVPHLENPSRGDGVGVRRSSGAAARGYGQTQVRGGNGWARSAFATVVV